MNVAIILKAPTFTDTVKETDVIYADAGYKFSEKIGKKNVLAVVGDFDSLGKAPDGEKIIGLNVEKNYTDGERAIRYAKELGAKEVTIYGAYGGKIEHVLGNIALLKIASDIGLKAKIKNGNTATELFNGKRAFSVKENSALSLIPYGGKCEFKSSSGLYYPLENLTLTLADTRGISNTTISNEVALEIISGEALIIYEE